MFNFNKCWILNFRFINKVEKPLTTLFTFQNDFNTVYLNMQYAAHPPGGALLRNQVLQVILSIKTPELLPVCLPHGCTDALETKSDPAPPSVSAVLSFVSSPLLVSGGEWSSSSDSISRHLPWVWVPAGAGETGSSGLYRQPSGWCCAAGGPQYWGELFSLWSIPAIRLDGRHERERMRPKHLHVGREEGMRTGFSVH